MRCLHLTYIEMKFFIVCCIFVYHCEGKPTLDKVKAGPCANADDPMDCLHGMLMHGDSDHGNNHKDEDTYLRFKSQLEAGKPKAKAGPLDAEQTFHGALMHGDGHVHHDDKAEILPKKPEKFGPQDAETMLHGVLMHGDGDYGHDHSKEDAQAKDKTSAGQAGPLDTEKMMHGLMHGDADTESNHLHSAEGKNTSGPAGPVDVNDMMHGLMHANGDNEHQHKKADDTSSKGQKGPIDQENLMHNLMHGGEGTDHKHGEKINKPFKFDIDEILKLDIPEDVLKSVGLDKVKKLDEGDYKKWKDEQEDNSEYWGETLGYISDSLQLDIDLMKQRYMAHDEDMEKEIEDYVSKKDGDFSASDVAAYLQLEGQNHDGDDTRHDLELVGSTEPINARHKIHLDMEKSKKKA